MSEAEVRLCGLCARGALVPQFLRCLWFQVSLVSWSGVLEVPEVIGPTRNTRETSAPDAPGIHKRTRGSTSKLELIITHPKP